MIMNDIHIISNLKLHPNKGLVSKDSDGKWIQTHHQQGDLDGACAVYSLIMNLLILGKISEQEISIYNKINRRTRRGKFLSHFLEDQGLIRDGYGYRSLAKEIRDYCPIELGIDAHRKKPHDLEETVKCIIKQIEDDYPAIISIEFSDSSAHALLAIGIEYNENNDPIRIMCLDPGVSSPLLAKWNCVIDFSISKMSNSTVYYMTDRTSVKVDLGDLLLITETDKV